MIYSLFNPVQRPHPVTRLCISHHWKKIVFYWGGLCIQPTDRSAIHTAASTRRYSRPTNQLPNVETARARSYSNEWSTGWVSWASGTCSLDYAEKENNNYLWHMAQNTRRIFLTFTENCRGGLKKPKSWGIYLLLFTTTTSTVIVIPIARLVTVSAAEVSRRRSITLPVVRVRVSPAPLVGAPSRSFGGRLVLFATTRFSF